MYRPLLLVPVDQLTPQQIPSALATHIQQTLTQEDEPRNPTDADSAAPRAASGSAAGRSGMKLSARDLHRFLPLLGGTAATWHTSHHSGTLTGAARRSHRPRPRLCVIPGCTAPLAYCEAHHITS